MKINPDDYIYLIFSNQEQDIKIKNAALLGKKYFPGSVALSGKTKIFTDVSRTSNSRYSDAKIVAHGYAKNLKFTLPYED